MSAKKNESFVCELCKQNVKISGFSLQTKQGKTYFCCLGCLSIYQLLNPDKIILKQ